MTQLISYINPFAEAVSTNATTKTQKDIQVEVGESNFIVDGIRNFMSIPLKLALWNPNFNSGDISPEIIKKVKNYLHAEGLHDVAVSINQYKPQEVWRRIFTNPKTSLLSKLTMGIANGLMETFTFSKVTGIVGDHYNASTNTLYLFSNDLAIALHECGHAKDFNSRFNPSLYASLAELPVVGSIAIISREYLATKNAIQHMECHDHDHGNQIRHAFKILTPALATYVATAVLPDLNAKAVELLASPFDPTTLKACAETFKTFTIGFSSIVILGHMVGRIAADQYQKNNKTFIFSKG